MKPVTKLGLLRPTTVALSKAAAKIEEGEDARLVVNVPERLHRAVKLRATERGLSISQYMRELLKADGVE